MRLRDFPPWKRFSLNFEIRYETVQKTAVVIEANGGQELARATQAYSDQGAGEVKRLQQRINELKLKNQTPEGAAV